MKGEATGEVVRILPWLLLLATPGLAGCLSVHHRPVIEIEEHFTWQGNPVGTLHGGDHCVMTHWDGDSVRLDRHAALPQALVVRRYDAFELASTRLSTVGAGGDAMGAFARDISSGQTYTIGQSFANGPLGNVSWNGHSPSLDGHLLADGAEDVLKASYAVNGGVVNETATVRFHASLRVVVDSTGGLCK
jgi:hypothetical protein